MPDTPLLPSDEELPTIEVPDGYLYKGHWIQNCRSAARNGGRASAIKVLPTIEELPPIEVPLVQLPKMSRTPWASFAMYDEPTPETRAEMRRLEALWGTSLWQMPAAVPLSSVLLPVACQLQDDDSRSEAGSIASYFTNRWLPAGIDFE
jgi:hypothetical protein